MKHVSFKIAAALVLILILAMCLTSCATKLSGTYSSDGLVSQSFTFKKDGTVVMSAFGLNVDGTYVIENGEITVSYKVLGISNDWTKTFEKKGESIYIDGTEFIKN